MKYARMILIVLPFFAVLALTSCEELLSSLFGTSIEDRIIAFEKTLNTAERTDILDHIHPDMKNRDQLKKPEVIEGSPIDYANHDFEFGSPSVDDKIATCSYLDGNGATGEIVFVMALDGYDYKILELKITVLDTTIEFKRLLSR
jgi:hypothetical protein